MTEKAIWHFSFLFLALHKQKIHSHADLNKLSIEVFFSLLFTFLSERTMAFLRTIQIAITPFAL